MKQAKELNLQEAVGHIRDTSERHARPFFFLVGAGISHPPVPLASEITEHCKKEAQKQKLGSVAEPPSQGATDACSYWFQKAYHSPADRQGYLRSLIEGKFVSQANFQLAHILLDKKVSNLVITTNFDDFLSRALAIFGQTPIVCDHPETVGRIDPERNDIQIVHVHGSYWFYDCCNLKGEVRGRSRRSKTTLVSMADFVARVCATRSPLVVGYSGWEDDVVMSVLRQRLRSTLPYNVYWFCYEQSSLTSFPEWLKSDPNVYFVVPPRPRVGVEELPTRAREIMGPEGVPVDRPAEPAQTAEVRAERSRLPARDVFEAFIQALELETPRLVKDPLGFLVGHLRAALPPGGEETGEADSYFLGSVVRRLERANEKLVESIQAAQLEKVLDAVRRSQYREAIRAGAAIQQSQLGARQLRELLDAIWRSAVGLLDDSEDELLGYDLVLGLSDKLSDQNRVDAALRERTARALRYKGLTLGTLNRSEEAIAVYDEVARRFGEATEPALREQVARALFNKGYRLGALNRSEEAIAVYDEVARRFGEATEPALREQVARTLVNKGNTLGALNRSEEAIAAYDEVARRFGEATEPALREQVAWALFGKGYTLGALNRRGEAIAVYDEVVGRFREATEPPLRRAVGMSLNNMGLLISYAAKLAWVAGEEGSARATLTEARTKISAALELNPENPHRLGSLAYIEYLLGNTERAREAITRAIELGGEDIRKEALKDSEPHPLPQDEGFRALVQSIPGQHDDAAEAKAAGA